MRSPVISTSALPSLDNHDDIDKISAYYSLAFPNFTYYLQTLTVTIGRRPIPLSGSSSDNTLVDVDLGPLKSVSRLHARIEYEEEEERFVLVVLGRNGAWVDGIWAGSGSKVPLGARSQIQIATRTFHFILPPPPAPETTSQSSPPSTARQRSPSVDITSISASSSRPVSPVATPGASSIADTHTAVSKLPKSSKKRKRAEPDEPLPKNMPPKPQATYAVMCYRAITSLGGKATLQDVVQWMIDNYEWYRLNVGGPWENSIRHNLSSNRAFRNAARSSEERGKGFLWGIDPQYEGLLRDQDAKARLAEQSQRQGHAGLSIQPLPMTESQLQQPALTKEPRVKNANGKKIANPPPAFTRSLVGGKTSPLCSTPSASNSKSTVPDVPNIPTDTSSSSVPQIPPNVILPIVVGPLPDSHPTNSATASALAASSSTSSVLTAPPIVLHSGTLILNPTIFSHLTSSQLRELEGLGAQKALEILQSHIVRFLKESRKLERSKGRGQGRGRGRGGATKGGGKGRSTSEVRANGADVVVNKVEGTARVDPCPSELPEERNVSATSTSSQSLLQRASIIDEEVKTSIEEPAAKRRKLDNLDRLSANGNDEAEIDVVGT